MSAKLRGGEGYLVNNYKLFYQILNTREGGQVYGKVMQMATSAYFSKLFVKRLINYKL